MEEIKLTDLNELKKFVNNTPMIDRVATNDSYGHMYILKKYAGVDVNERINATIEHGAHPDEFVYDKEIHHASKRIFTSSPYGKSVIEKRTDCQAISIGPFISYASDYYDEEELSRLKRKFGKTLLLFPTHGLKGYSSVDRGSLFCDRVESISDQYQTIMVCLYFYDLTDENIAYYQDKGYVIVSAGCIHDVDFLRRLRTIIMLSEGVAYNSYTSAVIYSLLFQKKIYSFQEDFTREYNRASNDLGDGMSGEFRQFINKIIKDEFESEEQKEKLVDYYIGSSSIRSREEMKVLLKG